MQRGHSSRLGIPCEKQSGFLSTKRGVLIILSKQSGQEKGMRRRIKAPQAMRAFPTSIKGMGVCKGGVCCP